MIDFYSPRNKSDVPLLLLFLLLLFIVLLSSCSAEWHIRRAIKKNPRILRADTIQVHDTLYTKEYIRYDSLVFRVDSNSIDSALSLIDNLEYKLKLKKYITNYKYLNIDTLIEDSVLAIHLTLIDGKLSLKTQKKQEQLPIIVEVPVERIVYAPKRWYERHWWIVLLVGLAVAVAIKR